MRQAAYSEQTPDLAAIAARLGDALGVDQCLRDSWVFVDDPPEVEFVRTPQLQIEIAKAKGHFEGDCDDSATFAAALCIALRIPCELIAIRNHGKKEFSHVWLRAHAAGAAIDIDPVTPESLLPISNYEEELRVWI